MIPIQKGFEEVQVGDHSQRLETDTSDTETCIILAILCANE
jgi:hypothetical protein